MAARNHDASLAADGNRSLELRLATFFFAWAAFEARINEVHEQRIGTRTAVGPDPEWRWRTEVDRLERLLGGRAMSRRRVRLIQDVAELWANVSRPAVVRFVQQMRLDGDGPFEDGNHLLLEAGPRYREERYRPARLPANPLDLEERHLRTCLLVILEHLVLLERRFRPEPPLRVRRHDRWESLASWFDELRATYEGPHAVYFRRIRLPAEPGERSGER